MDGTLSTTVMRVGDPESMMQGERRAVTGRL